MSVYINRPFGKRRGVRIQTTQQHVRAMLDDPAQRDELMRRTNRTVSVLRNLFGRDPREMAYVLTMLDNEIDAMSGFLDLTNLVEWVGVASAILNTHPQVRSFVERDDRIIIGGRLHARTSPEKGGPA